MNYIPIDSLLDLRRGDIIRLKNNSLSFVVDSAPGELDPDDEPVYISAVRTITVFDPSEIMKLEK